MIRKIKHRAGMWRVAPPKSVSDVIDLVLGRNSMYYWDAVYAVDIGSGVVRSDETILRLVPMLRGRSTVLDFGCGTGGNVKLLASRLSNTHFHLVERSRVALDYARNELLGDADSNGNKFFYHQDLGGIEVDISACICIEVLEHIRDFKQVLDALWNRLADDGTLIISVPVRGWWDRCSEHVNKLEFGKFGVKAG